MQVFLVGGAVRDEQLGISLRERDWCVVGATPEILIADGYKQVGKDFPVFLHPTTSEEYALARTERKTGPGYHGFAFDFSADVSIEDDLSRRDLTINAIAKDDEGRLIDPHGGLKDIEKRVLRHVSDAFSEDPVRILRVAKFAARFSALGFQISGETMTLMRSMVDAGEIDALVADRVWKETEEALCGNNSRVFFEVLRNCGALERLFLNLRHSLVFPSRPNGIRKLILAFTQCWFWIKPNSGVPNWRCALPRLPMTLVRVQRQRMYCPVTLDTKHAAPDSSVS